MLVPETISYHQAEFGAAYHQRYTPDGGQAEMEWRLESHLPNILALPDFTVVSPDTRHNLMIWVVPTDDTSHKLFFSIRASDPSRLYRLVDGIKMNGKSFWEMTDEELREYPSDNEAQGSQGPITLHSEETLATTDRGIVMLRRMLRAVVDAIEAGRDPVGVSREDGPPRRVTSGVFAVSTGVPEGGTVATTAGA